MIKWTAAGFWLIFLIFLVWLSLDRIPTQHNPFAPISMDHPLGLATRTKLSRLEGQPDVCFGFLDQSGIRHTRLEDSPPGRACGFYNVTTLDQSLLSYSATPLHMTCSLTSALAIWERQSVILRAKQHLDSPVVEVITSGSYNCRRLYGRKDGDFSEHAKSNAIDIHGFKLADGQEIQVISNWNDGTKAAMTEQRQLVF